MIELDRARSVLADESPPLAPRRLPLADALGCRLTSSASSDVDLPFADVAAMDGYAVRASDLDGRTELPVVFEVHAGSEAPPLPPRAVARVFTGAPVPDGADTVVRQEEVPEPAGVAVALPVTPTGADVRHRGEVLGVSDVTVPAGRTITPAALSLLAATGTTHVDVIPRPRLAVVVTGTEVEDPSRLPETSRIRDSNGPMLSALAAAAGLETSRLDRVADSRDDIGNALEAAGRNADVVVTTGGVSVGAHDMVPDAVRDLGGRVIFHGVRMKPGKPVMVARLGHGWLLGLPGNPLAVLAGWRMFAWPLLAALGGAPSPFDEITLPVTLEASTPPPGRHTELRPISIRRTRKGRIGSVVEGMGSHDLRAVVGADALARLEPDGPHHAGAVVPCYPLPTASIWPAAAAAR